MGARLSQRLNGGIRDWRRPRLPDPWMQALCVRHGDGHRGSVLKAGYPALSGPISYEIDGASSMAAVTAGNPAARRRRRLARRSAAACATRDGQGHRLQGRRQGRHCAGRTLRARSNPLAEDFGYGRDDRARQGPPLEELHGLSRLTACSSGGIVTRPALVATSRHQGLVRGGRRRASSPPAAWLRRSSDMSKARRGVSSAPIS